MGEIALGKVDRPLATDWPMAWDNDLWAEVRDYLEYAVPLVRTAIANSWVIIHLHDVP